MMVRNPKSKEKKNNIMRKPSIIDSFGLSPIVSKRNTKSGPQESHSPHIEAFDATLKQKIRLAL